MISTEERPIVVIIGEHANFPESKVFLVEALPSLAEAGFNLLLFDDVFPINNVHQQKHLPEDKHNVLGAYKRLNITCQEQRVEILSLGNQSSRDSINKGVLAQLLAPYRCSVHLQQIQAKITAGKTKLIVHIGLGLMAPIIKGLQEMGSGNMIIPIYFNWPDTNYPEDAYLK